MLKRCWIGLLMLVGCNAWAGEVRLAVAANFTATAEQLVAQFSEQSGHRVKVSYGSTGKLYAQIRHGAPYDLFLAADVERPQRAVKEGLALKESAFIYAVGQLALWSATPGLFDQATGPDYLQANRYSRLAIANPKTAPYGAVAQQLLQQQGLLKRARAKLVRGDSIAQTFQFVATGNAPVGFVALSQVRGWRGEKGSVWIPDTEQLPAIEQQAVLLKRGQNNPAATAFMTFLRSDKAQTLIQQSGYQLAAE